MKHAFASYHPVVNFAFFSFVMVFSMILMHPVCLLISLFCAIIYAARNRGWTALARDMRWFLPMMGAAVLMNAAFNHAGMTILAYLPSGNILTAEAVWYGIAAAVMLVTVILWFTCYHAVMTSDKFVYLFGRILPSLSLIFSMVLRFVPRFRAQGRAIAQAQRCMGRDLQSGSLVQRARHGVRMLSILLTWSMENALDTADSMRSRGYGLPGRTAFSIYRFDGRDRRALALIFVSGLYVLVGAISGGVSWSYFPQLQGMQMGVYTGSICAAYGILCGTPLIIEVWEEKKWKSMQSSI